MVDIQERDEADKPQPRQTVSLAAVVGLVTALAGLGSAILHLFGG
ncbi:hypothetical protein ABZU32_39095 [Sphaerisporangium sp. NPDC005288]